MTNKVVTMNGRAVQVVEGNDAFWASFAAGNWEPDTLKAFNDHITADTVVLDIGAWIGATALYAATRGREVYAFEPDPAAFATLKANIELNQLPAKVTLCNAAIGTAAGSIQLWSAGRFGDSMSSAVKTGQRAHVTVECIKLSDLLRQFESEHLFVKMDIEGFEYEVIPAAARALGRQDMTLLLAVHPQLVQNRLLLAMKSLRLYISLFRVGNVFDLSGRRLRLARSLPAILLGRAANALIVKAV